MSLLRWNDKFPSRQSDGDKGMQQPRSWDNDSDSDSLSPKVFLMVVQCHVAWIYVSGQFLSHCEHISDVNPILYSFCPRSEFWVVYCTIRNVH